MGGHGRGSMGSRCACIKDYACACERRHRGVRGQTVPCKHIPKHAYTSSSLCDAQPQKHLWPLFSAAVVKRGRCQVWPLPSVTAAKSRGRSIGRMTRVRSLRSTRYTEETQFLRVHSCGSLSTCQGTRKSAPATRTRHARARVPGSQSSESMSGHHKGAAQGHAQSMCVRACESSP